MNKAENSDGVWWSPIVKGTVFLWILTVAISVPLFILYVGFGLAGAIPPALPLTGMALFALSNWFIARWVARSVQKRRVKDGMAMPLSRGAAVGMLTTFLGVSPFALLLLVQTGQVLLRPESIGPGMNMQDALWICAFLLIFVVIICSVGALGGAFGVASQRVRMVLVPAAVGVVVVGVLLFQSTNNAATEASIQMQQAPVTAEAQGTATAQAHQLTVIAAQTAFAIKALTATPPPPPAGGSLIVQDAFDNNENNWDLDQYKSILNGKYAWKIGDGVNIYRGLPVMPDVRDFSTAIDVRFPTGAPKCGYGLTFRDTTGGNYVFYVQNDQRWSFDIIHSPDPATAQSGTSDAILPGAVNRVSVLARGDQMTLSVNDQVVGHIQDATLSQGRVGAAIWRLEDGGDCNAEFDNFEVRAFPNASVTPTPTPGKPPGAGIQ